MKILHILTNRPVGHNLSRRSSGLIEVLIAACVGTISAVGQLTSSAQLSSEPFLIAENAGTATISIRRTGDLDQAEAFDYGTIGGTARAEVDYLSGKGILLFESGQALQTIQIPILER